MTDYFLVTILHTNSLYLYYNGGIITKKDSHMMTFSPNIPNKEECQTCALTFAYKEINLLYEIAVILTSTIEIHESIEKAIRKLKQHGYVERCALFKKKEDVDELVDARFAKDDAKS